MISKSNTLEAVNSILNPKSIAIIGASPDVTKFSGMIISNLIKGGFNREIYPVNPKWPEIMGLKCYPSVKDIKGHVDLACIVVPAHLVPSVMEDCATKGVRAALVISAGFRETAGGEELQNQIIGISRRTGVRICGPNCEGVVSLVSHTWLTLPSADYPLPVCGNVALVTQSGGVGEYLLFKMWEKGIGVSHWISSGNEADLETSDYIEYLIQDSNTKVIVLFAEGIRNGRRFKEVAQMAFAKKKPIVMLKIGRSEKSKLTAVSHTGAITGSYEIYEAVCKQFGIIKVTKLDDLFEIAMPLASQPLPKGSTVGLITDSGGLACLVADDFEDAGIDLPALSGESIQKLRELLPSEATIKNPLDVTAVTTPEARAESLAKYVDILFQDENIAIVALVITWWPRRVIARLCENLCKNVREAKRIDKPILLCLTGATVSEFSDIIKKTTNTVPLYLSPDKIAIAIKALADYGAFLEKAHPSQKF